MFRTSDHWLTLMNCTVCSQTPDFSPLYRCPQGHLVCSTCYQKYEKKGMFTCKVCNLTAKFKEIKVSVHFLRKLKQRPGIGRQRRYVQRSDLKVSSESNHSKMEESRNKTITLEKLFRLPTKEIQDLFRSNQRLEGSENQVEVKRNLKVLFPESFVCPHGNCGVSITNASFPDHFKRDHSDIPVLVAVRGKPLHLIHDVRVVEFNKTICMAAIKTYEALEEVKLRSLTAGTFWLMVSGSVRRQKSTSYVLYWLLTNLDEKINCTLELSSYKENFRNCIFCPVSNLSQAAKNIHDISNQLNCLNLCYPSMCNLLQEGDKLHLRVTIH